MSALTPLASDTEGLSATGQAEPNGEVRLSLCMIVRDAQKTLDACLASIRPWVDEMVVVDTGSTDATVEIARRFGSRVFFFPWCDDFSKARNESIRHARGEWIFWMDADDTISEANGRRLRMLANRPMEEAPMAYVMQVRCPSLRRDCESDVTAVDHVKMFRNGRGLTFEGRIHEQILPAIRRVSGRIDWTDIHVEHSGCDQSPAGKAAKQQRDLRLLELEMSEKPDHPFVLFNIGMTYDDMGDYAHAIPALRRCIEVSDPNESHLRKAYAILVNSLAASGDLTAAWDVCRRGESIFPKDPELLFRRGVLAHRLGNLNVAVESYTQVLHERPDRQFASIDMGITGWKARNNLAAVYADLGRLDLAELQWRHVVNEEPHNRKGWQGLANSLIAQNKLVTAEVETDRMAADSAIECEAMILRARIAEARGDIASARRTYDAAIGRYHDDSELLRWACQFYFQQGHFEEAIEGLTRLCTQEPNDGAALHNLGTAHASIGHWREAVECFGKSLAVRPESPNTQQHLMDALDQLRRNGGETQDGRTEAGTLQHKCNPAVAVSPEPVRVESTATEIADRKAVL